MGILDTVYTYRFLRILSMKWESTDAYKLGIVDKDGNPLKKSKDLKTQEEKDSYTSFIRLVFKFKRLLTKIPAGKSALVRYGAALALIKENKSELEEMGVNMKKIKDIIMEYTDNAINEEVTNSTEGVAGKEQPLGKGKKGSLAKRKKGTCKSKDGKCKGGDDVEVNNSVKDTNEASTSKYRYQVINGIVIRVDEKRRVLKKRIIGGKRQKKREYASGKKSRFTRTGNRKLRSGTKVRYKHAHKKAYRKAHTASAEAKRRRSRRKRKIYAK
jgi:hypothetical protein